MLSNGCQKVVKHSCQHRQRSTDWQLFGRQGRQGRSNDNFGLVTSDNSIVVRVLTLTTFNNLVSSKLSTRQLWQLYGCQSCHLDNCDIQGPIHLVPNLGCHNDNIVVVYADNLDNLFGDNHKVVTLTTFLTPFWQPFVLCVVVILNLQESHVVE